MDSKMWSDMFQLGLPIVEKILRPILVYLFLIIGLRLAGKRELAQLNAFDLVVLMMLSNTVQNAIIGEDNSVTGGIIGACALLIINYLVVRLLYGHVKLDHLIEGEEVTLIKQGRVKQASLKKELITINELEIAAHRQGFASLEDVETAILEPGGAISFVGKKPSTEVVRYDELIQRLARIEALLIKKEAPNNS